MVTVSGRQFLWGIGLPRVTDFMILVQVDDYPNRDAIVQKDEVAMLKSRKKGNTTKKNDTDVANMRKRMTKEEKTRAAEEKKVSRREDLYYHKFS